ncbi:MAG: DUF2339 domain-containing protein [Gammaproteobacteria bacterium]|nr:DUF2339 domain-containing protein [Gammaproteobacteria bacterium]
MKHWKVATLFLVAMAAMSVASIFFPALPLVLVAGLIGAKIFAGSALGLAFLANIASMRGWVQKHPLRCAAVLGIALMITAICFASVFFPVLPVIFAVGALAAKCTAISTLALGAIGFFGSIFKGIRRRCTQPKNEDVFHDEGKKIKISDDVHNELLNNPHTKLLRRDSDDQKNVTDEEKYSISRSINDHNDIYHNENYASKYNNPECQYDDIQSCSDGETNGY